MASSAAEPATEVAASDRDFIDDLQQRTFKFFWETANPENGLVPDRWPRRSPASVAAVGFGLTAYCVGVQRNFIARDAAMSPPLRDWSD